MVKIGTERLNMTQGRIYKPSVLMMIYWTIDPLENYFNYMITFDQDNFYLRRIRDPYIEINFKIIVCEILFTVHTFLLGVQAYTFCKTLS